MAFAQILSKPEAANSSSADGSSASTEGLDKLPINAVTLPQPKPVSLKQLPKNLLLDQEEFWTTPASLRAAEVPWLIPVAGVTAGSLALDSTMENGLPSGKNLIRRSKDLSNYGVASLAGVDGGFYLLGTLQHNEHMKETGILGGEAAINALLVSSVLEQATQRERPLQGDGKGSFWHGGTSFPSDHSAAAWSFASVIAHEYPGPLTKLLAYGAAAAVSATRVTGREHFVSDVLIGSGLGWFMGRQVYNRHHDFDLDGAQSADIGTFDEDRPSSSNRGSPYVPLDSWIYPALDRLAGMGYVKTEFLGLRPWTRDECARLLAEADGLATADSADPEALRLYQSLAKELGGKSENDDSNNQSAQIESVYARVEGISGRPLSDSYHFGQTLINDFGRPYAQGVNAITGASGYATDGPLVFYVRGEYQESPSSSASAYPLNVRQQIAVMDENPLQPVTVAAAANQFQLLDSYVGLNLRDTQISFGKQSLWWGPGEGGPLLFSDNSDPLYMLRISQTSPSKLPSFLSILGPMRTEFFFGKFSGQHFPGNAYIHGEKISLKPTPNLELGFSRTAELGGVGRPLTAAAILHSYTSTQESGFFARNNNPGKRTGGFDFSYRLPFVRNWLTLYTDSLSSDDPSPLAAPRRAGLSPGLYLSHIPKLSKFDLRAEAVNTNTPSSSFGTKKSGLSSSGRFIYYDFYYHDLYTNKGNIIGSWVGREATGLQLWSTYWHSAKSTIRFGYRHSDTALDFLRGGTIDDFSLEPTLRLRQSLEMSSLFQYEKWNYPLLGTNQQSNFTTAIQLTIYPAKKFSLRNRPSH